MTVNISQDFDTLNEYFLRRLPGQEQIIRALLTSIKLRDICQNSSNFVDNGFMPPKLHTLVRGPSGCGKTFSINEMCRQLGIPFVAVNTTDFTSSGYVGASLTDIPQMLIEQARTIFEDEKREAKRAQRKVAAEKEKEHAKNNPDADSKNTPKNNVQARAHYRQILKGLKFHGIDLGPIKTYNGNLYRTPLFKDWSVFGDFITAWGKDPAGTKVPKTIVALINTDKLKAENKDEILGLVDKLITPIQKVKKFDLGLPDGFLDDMYKKLGISSPSEPAKRGVDEEDLIVNLAQTRGVILFDEFDKIFMDREGKYNVGTTGVIREILAYLSGSLIPASGYRGRYSGTMFDTSGVVFICAGAFDMVSHKDIPTEVLGRLAVRCKMEHPTEDTFYKMLTYPETGVFNILRGVLTAKGVTGDGDIITDETCKYFANLLVKDEKKRPIGIRRLTSVINILSSDVLLSKPEDLQGFMITKELIDKYCGEIRNSLIDF